MKWTDAQAIAQTLAKKYPGIKPLSVRFPDLERWVAELPEFQDDPRKTSEEILEAIQLAWSEEVEE